MSAWLARLRQPEAAPPWGVLGALGTVVAAFLALIIGAGLTGTLLPGNALAVPLGYIVGALLMVVFVLLTRRTPAARAALRLGPGRVPALIAFTLGALVGVTLDLVPILAGRVLPTPELAFLPANANAGGWLLAVALVLLLQPIGEELVFRGVLYPALRAAQGPVVAIVGCALFYGAFHALGYGAAGGGWQATWVGLVEPALAGAFLTGLRAADGSTRTAIFAHMGVGAFALLKVLALLAG